MLGYELQYLPDVSNWGMAGTKHLPAASFSWWRPSSYLLSIGPLLAIDPCVPPLVPRSIPTMMIADSGLPRPERRRAPRYRYQTPLEIEWGSALLKGRTRDISCSGMFIESEDLLWVGAGFRARLNTERPLLLDCSVKRVEPGLGMGVSFALLEDQSAQHFQELLSHLAASR
jgi:hypothetical protein